MNTSKKMLAVVMVALLSLILVSWGAKAYAIYNVHEPQDPIFKITYDFIEDESTPYSQEQGEEQFPDQDKGFVAYLDDVLDPVLDEKQEEIQAEIDELQKNFIYKDLYDAFDIPEDPKEANGAIARLINQVDESITEHQDAVLNWANTKLLPFKKGISEIIKNHPEIMRKQKIVNTKLQDPKTNLDYTLEAYYTNTAIVDYPQLKALDNDEPYTIDEVRKLLPELLLRQRVDIRTFYAHELNANVGVRYEYRVEGADNQEGLPQKAIELTPQDTNTYPVHKELSPQEPKEKSFTDESGAMWDFIGYDSPSIILQEDEKQNVFIGRWKLTPAKSTVTYTFERDPESDTTVDLPEKVKQLIPQQETHTYGETVAPKAPQKTRVEVEGGSWTFTHYTEKDWTVNEPTHSFVGYWKYEKTPETPSPTDPVKPGEGENPTQPVQPGESENPKNPDKETPVDPNPNLPKTPVTTTTTHENSKIPTTSTEVYPKLPQMENITHQSLPKTGDNSSYVAACLLGACAGIMLSLGSIFLKRFRHKL